MSTLLAVSFQVGDGIVILSDGPCRYFKPKRVVLLRFHGLIDHFLEKNMSISGISKYF